MINFKTKPLAARGVVWDGSPQAIADIIAITTCTLGVTRMVGAEAQLVLRLVEGEPDFTVEKGQVVLVTHDDLIAVRNRVDVEREFDPVLVP